ncbi:MAG: gliding motility-associated C-terminal domain-containing protein [Arcicella sp.]|nr:gliding motility-associated C-terminal domain-containing protein [Arcicella sp.]
MSEGFAVIDTHKINMKRITKNIAIALLGMIIWTLSEEMYAQCKSVTTTPVKGEFSINTVSVKGDGNGVATASNNIPIKICEGELINLKSTLPINSLSGVFYWITPLTSYNSLSAPPSATISAADNYTTITGSVDIKMIDRATDSQGFSFYTTPGLYVITQRDNSDSRAGGPGFHHACQVIEIVKPTVPDVQFNTCSGGQVITKFLSTANNIYDNYDIKYILSQGFQPSDTTGKIATYPFDFKNVANLSGYSSVKIEVKGVTKTGGCPAPASPQQTISLNTNVVNKPSLNAIVGTTLKGEFKLAVSADNNIKRNVYMRDPAIDNFFNYTGTPFKTYTSSATSGLDSNAVQVPNGDKVYCFQVEAVDGSCASSFVSNPALRSDELCTTWIDVEAKNNQNVIRWSQALGGGLIGANFVNYVVERFRPDGTFDKVLISTPNASTTTFTDDGVTCGQEYVYKVTTRYPLRSISQSFKVKATSSDTPPAISRVFATISNTGTNVRVQGQFNVAAVPVNIKPNAYKYYRAEGLGGSYTLLKSGNTFIEDVTADIDKKSYCYYMTWTNLCDNESDPSEKVCTVHLKSDGSTLKWTPESSLSVGTDSYLVQSVNPSTKTNIKVLKDNLIGIQTFDTKALGEEEGQELFIQIESRPVGWNTTDPNVLPSTLSNIIRVFRPSFSMTPQIFTPNGDGNNDKFLVRGKFIRKMKMTIYDRWGNVVYYEDTDSFPLEKDQSDSNVVGWNGIMNNGNRALEGSYAYKIEIEDTIGQVTTKEGALLLAY